MPLGAAAQTNPVLVGTVIDAARCGASSLEWSARDHDRGPHGRRDRTSSTKGGGPATCVTAAGLRASRKSVDRSSSPRHGGDRARRDPRSHL